MAIALLCLMMVMPLCMTMASDDCDAKFQEELGGINISSFDESMDIDAGDSYSITFVMFNTTSDMKIVSLTEVFVTDVNLGSVSYPKDLIKLDENGYETFSITVSINKFADAGMHNLKFTVIACDSDDSTTEVRETYTIPLKVNSNYAAGDVYNKFFGIIPNTLPAPFNDSLFTALITLLVWCLVSTIIGHIIYVIVDRKWSKNVEGNASKESRSIGRNVTLILILAGVTMCLKIFGASEILTGTVTDLITVTFIVLGAYVAWKVYKVLIYNFIVKYDKDDRIDDSLIPLFKMIGRIVVCVIALSAILSIYGFDLGAIVTSAGLVSLAISLGAQETLNQFFCGIQLMATRPFRIGDKVRLGTNTDVLIVRKIRVMDTEFKNWLNEEVFRVPNSTVMSSMITNITFDDKSYKIYEYVDVDYGADIEKAKEIMLEVVSSHPQVFTDGSKDSPLFRFSSMEASSIRLRVSYVIHDHEQSYTVSSQIRETIFKRFRAEGVKVPHNIVDVHMEE